MNQKIPSTRRQFLGSAALAASALNLRGLATAQQLPPSDKADQWVERGPGFQMDFWCLPRVQFWSFENQDPIHHVYGLAFSVQIITTGPDENTYSLHAQSMHQANEGDGVLLRATQLTTAGQQEIVAGHCEVRLARRGERIGITTKATVEKSAVRAIKLIFANCQRAVWALRVGNRCQILRPSRSSRWRWPIRRIKEALQCGFWRHRVRAAQAFPRSISHRGRGGLWLHAKRTAERGSS